MENSSVLNRRHDIRHQLRSTSSATTTSKGRLTLDEIRKGLKASNSPSEGVHSDFSPPRIVDVEGREFASPRLPPPRSPRPIGTSRHVSSLPSAATVENLRRGISSLSRLCEEVLVYCSLLESSRARAVEDTTKLQRTMRNLEKQLDAASQREMAHLAQVDQQRQIYALVDPKYRLLKSRAKQHIRECQEDREMHNTKCTQLSGRLQELESDLFSVQTLITNQKQEIEREKEASLNLRSPTDVADLDGKLRALENANEELRQERTMLHQALEDLQSQLSFSGGAENDRLTQLENRLKQLRAQNEDERKEQVRILDVLREEKTKYENYACELLNHIDGLEGHLEGGQLSDTINFTI